jgi:precorrin-2 C20-methyltransferase/precorrin-3B C17-methyltransferase
LPEDVLAEHLDAADAAVVMKLGRTFERVRAAAERAGVADRAVYVERASSERERVAPLAEAGDEVPYMSLVLLPTARSDEPAAQAAEQAAHPAGGSVAVVGLGPAGPEWLTPEARRELRSADVLVGYKTYVDRVPHRPRQVRHASDNRVEADRARHALQLAADGARVAVVSSGDPGIFAMASAVLEVLDGEHGPLAEVPVRIVPGLSAMQAAASRVGAPLGHDFAVISLSDILKPWPIIERRLAAAAGADLVVALYNPASRTRREQLERGLAVLREHRSPRTPVVVARAVGSDAEAVTVTTLGELDADVVDMRTLLIVGSSTTTIIPANGRGGPDLVYTPRSYPG